MSATEKLQRPAPSASEYVLDNFKPTDRIAVLVLNRQLGETTQRITTAPKASSPEFQAWLRYAESTFLSSRFGDNLETRAVWRGSGERPIEMLSVQLASKTSHFMGYFQRLSRIKAMESSEFLERAMGIEPNAVSRPINQIMLIRLPLHP
jgi:hypothetical protein